MASEKAKMVVVATIGTTHGVKGWLKLHSHTEPRENILRYAPLYLQCKGQWQVVKSSEITSLGDSYIIRLAGCDNREEAKAYTNGKLAVNREQLKNLQQDEYYHSDLEGLKVYTTQDVFLGQVHHVMETGANDVLVIRGEKEHLVPFLLEQVITKIDLDAGTMSVDWDPDF